MPPTPEWQVQLTRARELSLRVFPGGGADRASRCRLIGPFLSHLPGKMVEMAERP